MNQAAEKKQNPVARYLKKAFDILSGRRPGGYHYPTEGYVRFFIIFFIVNFGIMMGAMFITNGASFSNALFGKGVNNDLFMDFFNSIRDAVGNVYTDKNNIYPPLCILIFKFFGKFVRADYVAIDNNLKPGTKYLLQMDQRCMMIYLLFACVCILVLVKTLSSFVSNLHANKYADAHGKILTMLMCVGYPVLYSLERGNILTLCFVLTAFFIFFEGDENKIVSELALISLALAAGIKLYPAIFGAMLIFEKKYKQAVRCVIYGILAFALPAIPFLVKFIRTGAAVIEPGVAYALPGTAMISGAVTHVKEDSFIATFVANLAKFVVNSKSRFSFSSVSIQNLILIIDKELIAPAVILMILTDAAAVAALLFVKKRWQRLFLLCYIVLNIPAFSSSYSLMFLIIPLFSFLFEEKDHPKADVFYNVFFALLLTPIPTYWYLWGPGIQEWAERNGFYYTPNVNQLIGMFVFQTFFFVLLSEFIPAGKEQKRKKQKTNKGSAAPEQ
ncbi:MAG: glycosyltransferase 87 family protein [Clostridia bacterium]|nr:glycosyltransferase 87 family protein [Clostridia bacterium]